MLWLIAGARIADKLSHGQTNVFDLVILALLAMPFVRMAASPRRTLQGDRVFADLVARARPQVMEMAKSDTTEWDASSLAMAAVVGVGGIELARRIRMQARSNDGSVGSHSSHDSSSSSDYGGDSHGGGESSCSGGESSCGGEGGCGGGGD